MKSEPKTAADICKAKVDGRRCRQWAKANGYCHWHQPPRTPSPVTGKADRAEAVETLNINGNTQA